MNERRSLYLCRTLPGLMNSVVARLTAQGDGPADLLLEDDGRFSAFAPELESSGVFGRVLRVSSPDLIYDSQRARAGEEPSALFSAGLAGGYTDLWVNSDSPALKSLCRVLRERGERPALRFVMEGPGAYLQNFEGLLQAADGPEEPGSPCECSAAYLYHPGLRARGPADPEPLRLPPLSGLSEGNRRLLDGIFGKARPIREKLIFFEAPFWGEGALTNEADLFLTVAEIVGKEDLIVLRHPQSPVDRFTPLGYRAADPAGLPWEIRLKDEDLGQKALVSADVLPCFSAWDLCEAPPCTVLLTGMLRGTADPFGSPERRRFFLEAQRYFNSGGAAIWSPETLPQLRAALEIVEEKIGGWKA